MGAGLGSGALELLDPGRASGSSQPGSVPASAGPRQVRRRGNGGRFAGYVSEHLGNPDAVLVVDETGEIKKGAATVGPTPIHWHRRLDRKRQSGAVFSVCGPGRAGVPWLAGDYICPRTDVPDEIELATKPVRATQMIIAALDAGVPARWAADDEIYGADPELRQRLQQRVIG